MHCRTKPALASLAGHARVRAASSATNAAVINKWAHQPAVRRPSLQSTGQPSGSKLSEPSELSTPANKWAPRKQENSRGWGSETAGGSHSRTVEHPMRRPARSFGLRPSSPRPSKASEHSEQRQRSHQPAHKASPRRSAAESDVSARGTSSHLNERSSERVQGESARDMEEVDRTEELGQFATQELEAGEDEEVELDEDYKPARLLQANELYSSDGTRNRKREKLRFRDRGSLLESSSEALNAPHERYRRQENEVAKKSKLKRLPKARPKRIKVDLHIPSVVSVGTLSRLLNVSLDRLQWKMREAGMTEQTSSDHILTTDYAALLAEEFGRNAVIDDEAAFDIYPPPPAADASTLPHRPPIVTIMGHVDHGKTTLLDSLRSTSVAAGEAGGITQHIGAFSVRVPGSSTGPSIITFLDTPGHAAFSAMRARGARVTDIIVLVVAADDGVMPQTKEVIDLVQKDGKVQLVVAINKIDKPDIDLERVQNSLLVENVHVESIGGDVPAVQVSGLTGKGLNDLTETISAVSELQDLRAERDGPVHGYVLESKVQKGFGAVATVLVLRGCLRPGAHIIAGLSTGRVRTMTDSAGKTAKAAYPGDAVTVSGWKDLPAAGDEVLQGADHDIRKALANRIRKANLEKMIQDVDVINVQRSKEREQRVAEILAEENGEDLPPEVKESGPEELRLLIKCDVSGSAEALTEALQYIGNDLARVKVIASEVGEVASSDILRAKTADAMIVAFSVPVSKSVQSDAHSTGVTIHSSSIIYQVIDEVRARVTNLLPQQYAKKVTGEAAVFQIFEIHLPRKRIKKVAGCRVTNGLMERSKRVQVVRNGEVIFEGRLDTFKYHRDDITEARKGVECGISLEGFDDIRSDDLIQAYNLDPLPKFLA